MHTVTLSVGKASSRTRPSYALYVPHSADVQVPAHVGIEGCRARCSEGIRLRCTSTTCPLRQAGLAATTDAEGELASEDLDEPDFESCFDAQEQDPVDGDDVAMEGAGAAGGDCTVNIFPYAAPMAVHARLHGEGWPRADEDTLGVQYADCSPRAVSGSTARRT